MHRTKNDLAETVRAQSAGLLAARLTQALDLRNQAKQAHWNVKGPNFIALHELFDTVVDEVADHADLIAERMVMLGGTALGTVQHVAKQTDLPEFPADASNWRDVIDALTNSMAAFGKSVRAGIGEAEAAGDADTADLLTEVSRALDKSLWFVESHLSE